MVMWLGILYLVVNLFLNMFRLKFGLVGVVLVVFVVMVFLVIIGVGMVCVKFMVWVGGRMFSVYG